MQSTRWKFQPPSFDHAGNTWNPIGLRPELFSRLNRYADIGSSGSSKNFDRRSVPRYLDCDDFNLSFALQVKPRGENQRPPELLNSGKRAMLVSGRKKKIMKMLFSPSDSSEARQVRKKLSQAGVHCALRKNPISQNAFGIPLAPELFIKNERDILKAFRLLGARRLREMVVIVSSR